MSSVRTFQKAFAGGVLTPEFFGRVDDAKFQTGLAICRNMIIKPHGPAANRPGTTFVAEVKDSSELTKLLPFVYSTTQTMVLEAGAGYFRFHTAGGTLLAGVGAAYNNGTAYNPADLASSGGINYYCILATTGNAPPNATYWYPLPSTSYEIPTPYATADLFDLHIVQSDDVLTLVHPNYPPMELERLGATQWLLETIAFASKLVPPTSVTATQTHSGGGTLITMNYVVTSVDATGIEESLISNVGSCTNNIFGTGAINTIAWTAAPGAVRYNVYRQDNGLYGYIGQTDQVSYADQEVDDIVPDLGKTPPIQNLPFNSANNYPGAVTYFQQRKDFAGTLNKPQNVFMTRTGTEANLSYSIPTHDDDSINFKIAAREANTIRHLVPLSSLLVLTSAAEYRITSINSDAITPTSVSVTPQSYIGASNVTPVIVNNNLLFKAARGNHTRELAYAWQSSGYITGDLSLRAPHLFDGLLTLDMAYAKCPYPISWECSSSGNLLGITYVPEQQIGAWHVHDSYTAAGQSLFESVCVVPEGDEDGVYVVVNRVINGATKRYIERFASQLNTALATAYYVDAGISYSGAPISVITSGLSHLIGETVSILADGAVAPPQVVNNSGGLDDALPAAASNIQIGLQITADMMTLPVSYMAADYGQGRKKNVNQVYLRVTNSSGIYVGPSFDKLKPYKQRTNEPLGSPPRLITDEISIVITPSWNNNGQVCIRQSDPLPLCVDSICLELEVGG